MNPEEIRYAPNRDPAWGKGELRDNCNVPVGARRVVFTEEEGYETLKLLD